MTDNQANSNYQDILDKYAQSLTSTEDSQIPQETIKPEPELEPKNPPEAILTPEEEILLKSQSQTFPEDQLQSEFQSEAQTFPEDQLQSEFQSEAQMEPPPQIEAAPSLEAIDSPPVTEAIVAPSPQIELPPESSETTPKRENHFFKYLFFFSLFVFIIISISVVISIINSQKNIPSTIYQPNISPSPANTVTSFCELNNQKYSVGESFAAADACNTCTCDEDLTISCTQETCDATDSATPAPDSTPTLSPENSDEAPSL